MTISPLDLLDSGNFQTYNRKVAKELGSVNAAIMLSELVNRYNYHKDNQELLTYKKHEGVWFYYTVEKCEERTVLSRKEQETAIKILEKRGLFTKRAIGIPPKRHFCLEMKKILEFVCGLKNLFIKAEKGAMNGPKRAVRNAPKGPNNKEPQEELQENNNKPPAVAAQAVVVFSIFDELEINKSMRERLSSQMDEQKAQRLVQRVIAWKGRESDAKACNTILGQWETWEDNVSKEDRFEVNKVWTQENLKKYDEKKVGAYGCLILGKLVEFSPPGTGEPKFFSYDTPSFQAEVTHFINKNLK